MNASPPNFPKARSVALIVDDIADNREILDRYLSAQGFQTVCCDGGIEALDYLSHRHADIVILDWMMPDLDGLQTLKAIRERFDSVTLPVIMCTAVGESMSIVNALSSGANDYITKPVDLSILRARVEGQMRQRTMYDQMNADRQQLEAELTNQRRRMLEQQGRAIGARA